MNETTQETLVTSAALAAKTYEARAYAAPSASSPLAPTTIRRRAPGPRDVQIEGQPRTTAGPNNSPL